MHYTCTSGASMSCVTRPFPSLPFALPITTITQSTILACLWALLLFTPLTWTWDYPPRLASVTQRHDSTTPICSMYIYRFTKSLSHYEIVLRT
ncbi:hypothetical protein FVEG_16782 [Fusarium verticillioides 7600]|uniref:Uncharacterized protein n=1 Tax=Gibberella moniliformis (strain M3125 / FGSC 7600) TaxID=334819 RepID=W7MUE0_GIBM7|nr:hypothetical protein FVEG_16782 [Fusarium verticillioides 7600]EWG51310.1 hypothetical protein FVEG_16782 [Fusarium verticillioides 7600]